MGRLLGLLLLGLGLCGMAACAQRPEPLEIRNDHTAVRAVLVPEGCIGFDVLALGNAEEAPVAEVRWTSGRRWVCAPPTVTPKGEEQVLEFGGEFRTDGTRTPGLGPKTSVRVTLLPRDPFPHVAFTIEATAFDEAAWRAAWETLCPLYFLRCSLPGEADQGQVFYQGGELYPGPRVDPYPITMGPMRGNWSENWSYAPAIGAAPIPAVGLWSPASRLFVAYEFQEPRLSDQSDLAAWPREDVATEGGPGPLQPAVATVGSAPGTQIASAYCAGRPDHPGQFVCLAYPHAAQWLSLRLPTAPFTIGTRFRLLYSREMPSDSDPNRWVIRELLATYADRLPPAPRMNDMSWLRQGREASQLLFLRDIGEPVEVPRQNVAPLLYRPWEQCEQAFFEPGATQLAAHQTGKASSYAWLVGDEAGLAAQKAQLDTLVARAKTERFGGDECFVWEHPLDGTFKAGLGGAAATGTRHMFNWGIASAMLHWYRHRHTTEYLPTLDGMVRWTRHYLYDRAGMADLPWAVFSMGAANGGEFLLDYCYTFRDDPERAALAAEAFRLAEVVVYRNTYYYTSDPDTTDTLDPTFLLQAVNSHYWLGQVTWGEMGRVPEMCIQMYLETGDPFFEYLARGCLERFYVGTVSAAGNYTENLSIFGETGPKGTTSGGWGGNNFRWLAEPLGSAIVQVDVGQRGAMAFCRGTRAVDIADYAFRPEASFGFGVVVDRRAPGAPQGPFDIMVTAPRRVFAGATIRVNGQPLRPERAVVGTAGTDALLRGVRDGDRVTIGEVGEGDRVELRHYRPRGAFDPPASQDFECLDLTRQADAPVDSTWSGPWGGLIPGPAAANGVYHATIDPDANAQLGAVDIAKSPTVEVGRPGPAVLLWGLAHRPAPKFGPTVVGQAVVRYADGTEERLEVRLEDAAEAAHGMEWYDKDWVLLQVPVGRPGAQITSLRLEGQGLLFAVTTPRPGSTRGPERVGNMLRVTREQQRLRSYQAYATPTEAAPQEAPWWDPELAHRALLVLDGGDRPRRDALIRVREAFDAILQQVGTQPFAPTRVRVCEVDAEGKVLQEAPAQFDPDAAGSQRGELLLKLPGEWPGGERRFYVYFGAGPPRPAAPELTGDVAADRVTFSSGAVMATFALSGQGPGPRLTELRFGEGPNLLAKAGWDEGFGHLCACQDGVTWYDFGALQDDDARAEVVSRGPLAMTVKVSGLRLYGAGTAQQVAGVGTPGRTGAAPKGEAQWCFRLYAGDPRVDSWVEATIFDPDTRWTRPFDARFGTASVEGARTVGGGAAQGSFAEAGGLALVALDDEAARPNVRPFFTGEDGAVPAVSLGTSAAAGAYRSDRWRMMPAGEAAVGQVARPAAAAAGQATRATDDAWYEQQGAPVGVTQYAVERLEGARIIRPAPQAVEVREVGESVDWSRLLPYARVATLVAGEPDGAEGLRSRDNPDEGTSRREQVAGRWAIVPGTPPAGGMQQFFYFDVDDAVVGPTVPSGQKGFRALIAVEYYDLGRGTISLEYDSADLRVTQAPQVPGAFKEATAKIQLEDSRQWRTFVFAVPDARFTNGCNGADFRLNVTGGALTVSRVAVAFPEAG